MGIKGALAIVVAGSALLALAWISMISWISIILFGVCVLMTAAITIWYIREGYNN
jgi:hypothetical protein